MKSSELSDQHHIPPHALGKIERNESNAMPATRALVVAMFSLDFTKNLNALDFLT